jgi:hypothetical protein
MKSDRAVTASDGSAVIDDVIRAINDHNLDRFVACYAPEAMLERDDAVVSAGQTTFAIATARRSRRFRICMSSLSVAELSAPFFVQEKTVTGRSD